MRVRLELNRDCLASLKCRTPCQNRHDYRINHHPRKSRPKTTRVKAKSLPRQQSVVVPTLL